MAGSLTAVGVVITSRDALPVWSRLTRAVTTCGVPALELSATSLMHAVYSDSPAPSDTGISMRIGDPSDDWDAMLPSVTLRAGVGTKAAPASSASAKGKALRFRATDRTAAPRLVGSSMPVGGVGCNPRSGALPVQQVPCLRRKPVAPASDDRVSLGSTDRYVYRPLGVFPPPGPPQRAA